MIDELLGSNKEKEELDKEFSDQQDGKIVDHLYTYPGLMEAGEDVPTYYIGDSKYYKMGSELGKHSIYKQNTYARNIIQYNLDLWDQKLDHQQIRLRDELTEGYNILPNFFISASMKENDYSYTHDQIERKDGGAKLSYQFRDRLFDRDTLLLSHYNVNFLFVVALYARNNAGEKNNWQKKVRAEFRQAIQNVLRANYDFYALRPKNERYLESWINQNFKDVHGKIFRPYEKENLFILALEKTSDKVQNALHGKDRKPLEQEEVKQEQPAVETEKQSEVKSPKEQEAQDLLSKIKSAFVVQPVDKLDAPLDVAIEAADRKAEEKVGKEELTPISSSSVLVGYYKDSKHLEWIINKKMYNVRLGEAKGSMDITPQLLYAKYVLLHGKDGISLWELDGEGPKIKSKEDLVNNYKYPSKDMEGTQYYLVFKIKGSKIKNNVLVEHGFDIDTLWDKLGVGYKSGLASRTLIPHIVTIPQVMDCLSTPIEGINE